MTGNSFIREDGPQFRRRLRLTYEDENRNPTGCEAFQCAQLPSKTSAYSSVHPGISEIRRELWVCACRLKVMCGPLLVYWMTRRALITSKYHQLGEFHIAPHVSNERYGLSIDVHRLSPLSFIRQLRLKATGGNFEKSNATVKHANTFTNKPGWGWRGCTRTYERCILIIKRRRGRSRLVAVWPPQGMINVSSHLITTWPAALARDGWRSVNGGGEREGLCPRAKISNDSSPRFCKDMQRLCKHTCTQRASTHVHAHSVLSALNSSYFILVFNGYFFSLY